MFGLSTDLGSPYMLLAMPLALQEMVFAVYLVVRGLRVESEQRGEQSMHHIQPAGMPS